MCHHIGITQRPRGLLFQKSGHMGATCAATGEQSQIDKFENKFFMAVTKYLTKSVIRVNFLHYMLFIILLSHRGLMTIYFKSRGIWEQLEHTLVSKQKSTKFKFFCPDRNHVHPIYVKRVNLFTDYVIHHIGITQRPHDHLFQK